MGKNYIWWSKQILIPLFICGVSKFVIYLLSINYCTTTQNSAMYHYTDVNSPATRRQWPIVWANDKSKIKSPNCGPLVRGIYGSPWDSPTKSSFIWKASPCHEVLIKDYVTVIYWSTRWEDVTESLYHKNIERHTLYKETYTVPLWLLWQFIKLLDNTICSKQNLWWT